MKAYKELVFDTIKLNVDQISSDAHSLEKCIGSFCPVHNPSEHHLLDKPLIYEYKSHSFFRKTGDTIYDLIIDPDDYRYNNGLEVVLRNSAECLECKTSLISIHCHHFSTCYCGNLSIAGGFDYTKRMYCIANSYVDTSILFKKKNSIYIYPDVDAIHYE